MILKVVGVLPHVAGQQGTQRQGGVLVGGLADGQRTLPVADQPGPPGAEYAQSGGFHSGFESGHPAQVPVNGGGQGFVRPLAGRGRHALEIQRVVVHAAGIVADALAEVPRQAAPILTELLQRPALAGGTGGQ